MVVLEVLGHLGELTALTEAEEGGALVDVDDTLSAHTEGEAAVFVHHTITG